MRGQQTPHRMPEAPRLGRAGRLAIALAPRTLRHTGAEAEAAARTLAEVTRGDLRTPSAAQLAAQVAATEAASLARCGA